jgi:hypothetical protein
MSSTWPRTGALDRASYTWPSAELTLRRFGAGRPRLGVGLLPHSNEPLGSAVLPCLDELLSGTGQDLLVIDGIDPPPQPFSLPCDFFDFLRAFHLPRIAEQVEFAHCVEPATPAQHRARRLCECLRSEAVERLLLVHNDPFARHPYFYAGEPHASVEQALLDQTSHLFDYADVPEVGWTEILSRLTYRYFPVRRIDPGCSSESAGIFIAEQLRIPVLTLELPMFDWAAHDDDELWTLRQLYLELWHGAASADKRDEAIAEHARQAPAPMVPAAVSARVEWAVIASLLELLEPGYSAPDHQ